MSQAVKIVVYAVLVIVTVVFGSLGYADYRRIMKAPVDPQAATQPMSEEEMSKPATSKNFGRMMTFGGFGFVAFVGLAMMLARDISRLVAEQTEHFLMSDEGEGIKTPEYEEAEKIWAEGDFLGAIRLMREHLKKHPLQVHVARRIAEVYERDLENPLAAALELEEVLKQKLPSERWGWWAIHLANLYSGKLNKPDQAVALLRRIVREHGATVAARKARERLGLDEPAPSAAPEAPAPEPPKPNLPPGFRPLNP